MRFLEKQKPILLRKIVKEAEELLYPGRCPLCGEIAKGICASCSEKVHAIEQPRCFKCGKQLLYDETEYCNDCRRGHHRYQQGCGLFPYEGIARESIHKIKYENKREYLDTFARMLAERFEREIRKWDPEILVPIPMFRKKQRMRGFNQSELLAKGLQEYTGIPMDRKLLIKTRDTGEQKELSGKERRSSLQEAFYADNSRGIQRILLVDDVYTTGSTMDAAAAVLQDAGVQKVYFLVICIGTGDT